MPHTHTEYKGRIVDGVVVLDDGKRLPEGAEVRVTPVEPEGSRSTLGWRLLELAGIAEGLPSDLARNHDYYLHGLPKKR